METGKKLRIAMLSVHSCPIARVGAKDTGGMNVYIRELARQLGQRGYLVDIFTRAHDPGDAQIVEFDGGVRLIHLEAGEVEDIHKLVLYSYLADFSCNLENFRKANELEYDLIHSHYWLSGWVGKRIQDWWKVPHVTMFHTLGAVKNAVGVGEDDPELRLQTERELARDCDHIIAATENERAQLVGYCNASPDAISVIPCGVNLDLFRPLNKKTARQQLDLNEENIALFVGRIEPLKGIDRLLTVVAHVRKKEKVHLVVVGGYDESQAEMERLTNLAQELNVQDSVTFAGMVEHEELPQYYCAADVCVIPSHYESFGLVALESLACGTPVVATRVGGIDSLISQGENGYVVDGNPIDLADKVVEVLLHPDISAETAMVARQRVFGFGWPNIAQEMVREYRSVLSGWTSQCG